MVNYLLKKSYQLKDLKEIEFKDLWGDHGVFTTMWIFGNPPKILFFKDHINNLIKSSKAYSIYKTSLKNDILASGDDVLIKLLNAVPEESFGRLAKMVNSNST